MSVLACVTVVLIACAPAAREPSAVAHFDVNGERFRVIVTDEPTIEVLR